MQLYDATNKQGICQEIDRLCDTTDTSYPRVDKTSRINRALEEIVGKLIALDGTWQFDDSNYTTLPIGTYTLVEGQASYSFANEFLDIEEIDILTAGGQYKRISPIDHNALGARNISGQRESGLLSIEEFFGITQSSTPKGMPTHYDKWEDSVKLYPAPGASGVTLTAGMKVYFKRKASLFTVASDTSADTTEPGFASPWHVLLAHMAAVPYNAIYHQDRVNYNLSEIARLQEGLFAHYGKRQKDVPRRMSASVHNNK